MEPPSAASSGDLFSAGTAGQERYAEGVVMDWPRTGSMSIHVAQRQCCGDVVGLRQQRNRRDRQPPGRTARTAAAPQICAGPEQPMEITDRTVP